MDVDLRLLRYFVVVADELHVTRAAERLRIAQPVLSRQIRQLEARLGVELLRRTARHVELTRAGEVLAERTRTLLEDWETALSAVRQADAEAATVLRVGFSAATVSRFTPRFAAAFGTRRPGWRVAMAQSPWSDPYVGLLDGTVDAALLRVPVPDDDRLRQRLLFTEHRCVALASDHPLAEFEAIRFEQLLDEPFVALPAEAGSWRDFWLCADERRGRPPTVGAVVATPDEWVEAITLGLGVAVTAISSAQYYDRPGLTYRPLEGVAPCGVAVGWRRGERRPAVQDFVHACIAEAGNMETR